MFIRRQNKSIDAWTNPFRKELDMCRTTIAVTLLSILASLPAAAQKVTQVYTAPFTSHESRVKSCASPTIMNRIAMDDWTCPGSGPIKRITWWGTLNAEAQRTKRYYFAIYTHTSPTSCKPANLVWKACVAPTASSYVMTDCKQRRVFKFETRFPAPFNQITGTRYWLQISEIDDESAQPGKEDFRWSPHRPIVKCRALQKNTLNAIITPLKDECDGKEDDLAFVLWPT